VTRLKHTIKSVHADANPIWELRRQRNLQGKDSWRGEPMQALRGPWKDRERTNPEFLLVIYSIRPKIFAPFDFYRSHLTIRLIQNICENVKIIMIYIKYIA
jgi:hypothetical protein